MTITHVTTVEPAGQTAPSDEIRHSPRKTYPQNWPAYNAAQASEVGPVLR